MTYVVIYDHLQHHPGYGDKPGDMDELIEEYYGYFADYEEAKHMFGNLLDSNPNIIRAQLCVVEKEIDIDALRAERALRRANGEQL